MAVFDILSFMSAIDHPNPRVQKILRDIEPSFYADCLKELAACRSKLNFSQFRYALEVIAGMAWLERNAESLARELNESARNRLITEKTSLMAEPGLIPGNTEEGIKKIVAVRIEMFKQAFSFDKERDALPAFFAYAFVGPPCFNGRLITLQEYILKEQKGIATYDFECHFEYDKEACDLEEILYELKDHSLEKVKEYLKETQNLLGEHPHLTSIYKRACEFVEANQ